MSSPESHREHPSTYFVQDRANLQELDRVSLQDQMLTAGMGGVLPEQAEPTRFARVLDVGCGTGGWLLEAARTYPTMTRLAGIDVSERMIAYAQQKALEQGVADRVQFHTMDALRMLEFPSASFDLVNQRLGESYLRKWDWPKLLREFQRVTRKGGVIRLTETDLAGPGSSPALSRLSEIMVEAFYQAGHLFTPRGNGLSSELDRLLRQHGVVNIQTYSGTIEYRAGTPEGTLLYEDTRRLFQNIKPFLRKWTRIPDDYDNLYQQMLREMQQPDFVVIGGYTTAWGERSR